MIALIGPVLFVLLILYAVRLQKRGLARLEGRADRCLWVSSRRCNHAVLPFRCLRRF
jgi:hypothetical protein